MPCTWPEAELCQTGTSYILEVHRGAEGLDAIAGRTGVTAAAGDTDRQVGCSSSANCQGDPPLVC
jgi:hypothetical protein